MTRKSVSSDFESVVAEEARDKFLAARGFRVADYAAPTFTIGVLGLSLKFPNPRARKCAVPLHDLHHILTGFWERIGSERQKSVRGNSERDVIRSSPIF